MRQVIQKDIYPEFSRLLRSRLISRQLFAVRHASCRRGDDKFGQRRLKFLRLDNFRLDDLPVQLAVIIALALHANITAIKLWRLAIPSRLLAGQSAHSVWPPVLPFALKDIQTISSNSSHDLVSASRQSAMLASDFPSCRRLYSLSTSALLDCIVEKALPHRPLHPQPHLDHLIISIHRSSIQIRSFLLFSGGQIQTDQPDPCNLTAGSPIKI